MTTTPILIGAPRRRALLPVSVTCVAVASLALALGPLGSSPTPDSGPTSTSLPAPQLISTGTPRSSALSEADTDWRDLPMVEAPDATDVTPPIDKLSDRIMRVASTGDLIEMFDTLGYDFAAVRDLGMPVPRVFLAELPADYSQRADASQRIDLFLNMLLPLTLRVNEGIAAERERLMDLSEQLGAGATLSDADSRWLRQMAEIYRVDTDTPGSETIDRLLLRVDIVPPSMALAQAAVESGWGTSSLARNGNALFGQTGSSGIRASTGHTYATFDQLIDAVDAYIHNLNTNPAYASFRDLRAAQRAAGEHPDGVTLMGGLTAYSELGSQYIRYIRNMIRSHGLDRIDDARLQAIDEQDGGPALPI